MSHPRYRRARQHKVATPATGSTSIDTVGAWEDLVTYVPSFTDITLHKCQFGDTAVVYLAGSWGDEAFDGELSVVTAGGNYIPVGTNVATGVAPWRGRPGQFHDFGAFSPPYSLQVADIQNDWDVAFRLRVRTTGAKTFIYGHSWSAETFGPKQKDYA